jgi:hypothetical protein
LESFEDRVVPATIQWTNSAGGDWDTSANWDLNRVPAAGDDAIITITGITVTHAMNTNDQVQSITSQAALDLSQGTLNVSGTVQVTPALTLQGGTLANATVAVGTTVQGTPAGGSLSGVTLNGNLDLASASGVVDISGLINHGTISADVSGGSISISGAGWRNTGTIQAAGGGTIHLQGSNFINQGTISAQTGSTVDIEGSQTTAGLGSITNNSNTGTVNILGTLDNTGHSLLMNAATGSWKLANATILGGTIDTADAQLLQVLGGDTAHFSAVTVNGTLRLSNAHAAIQVTNGLTVNSTINLSSGIGSSDGLVFMGGNQTVAGTGTITGSFEAAAINVGNNMTLTLGPGLTVRGAMYFNSGNTNSFLVNQGTIISEGAYININGDNTTNTGTIQVASGSETILNGNHFNNQGTVSIQSGSGGFLMQGSQTTVGLGSIVNMGTFIIATGIDNTGSTLQLNGGSWFLNGTIRGGTVHTVGTTALSVVIPFAVLDGVTLDGTVDVSGIGALSVIDGLTLTANGLIQLGRINDTTDHGRLVFGGNQDQTLSGTGSIVFGSDRDPMHSSVVEAGLTPGTLTIGPGVTIRGDTGTITCDSFNSLVNQGTISADVSDGSISLTGSNWTNTGTIQATSHGTIHLQANGFSNQGTIRAQGSNSAVDIEGNQTTTGLGSITSTGGAVNVLGTINNTGNTLSLTASTGSWNLLGGTIQGGTIQTATGIALVVASNSSFTSGVTLDGTLDFSASPGHTLSVTSGLTVNGTIQLGSIGNTTGYGTLNFMGNQTLGGTGSIVFGSDRTNLSQLRIAPSTTLTIGSGLTIAGDTGTILYGDSTSNLTNAGTITDNVSGGTITIMGTGWHNSGTIVATNGGTVRADQPNNYSSGTLTGGTWQVFANSSMRIIGASITTNAATILLDGATSHLYSDAGTTDALAGFATNAATSAFTIQTGRNFTTGGDFINNGTLTIGDTSTFTIPAMPMPHSLTNFSSTTHTLTGGTFNISGQLQFPGADIHTNASNLTIGGTQPHPIFDNQGMLDGLTNLATNNMSSTFAFQQSGHTFTAASFTNSGTLIVGTGATFIATSLTTFDSTTHTLMGGEYMISGTFDFGNADIHTNDANLVLDGPGWGIFDLSMPHNRALDNFTTNAMGATFCTQNGAGFNFPIGFSNNGRVCVGVNSTYTLHGGDSVSGTGTLEIMGGALMVVPGPERDPTVTINTRFFNNHGTVQVASGVNLVLMGQFDNYSSGALSSGTFTISGKLQFQNANIQTNAALLTLDGAGAAIQDQNSVNALTHLTTNSSGASLTITNGASLTDSSSLQNNGTLSIGPNGSFTAGANFTQTGTAMGTVQINATGHLVLDGQTNFDSGMITGGGTVTVPSGGQFNWTGGTMSGSGTTMIAISGALNLSGSNSKFLAGWQIANAGTVTVNGAGPLWFSAGATIDNQSTGLFVDQTDVGFGATGGATSSFVNDGTFRKSSSSSGFTEFYRLINFHNTGTVDVQGGTLQLDGPVTNSGIFTIESNAQINVYGTFTHSGTATLQTGATLRLLGNGTDTGSFTVNSGATLRFEGTNWVVSGSFNLAATDALVRFIAGTVALNAGTSFMGDGLFYIVGGTVSVNTAISVANAAIAGISTLTTSTLTGSGTFTVTTTLGWTGGTMTGTGTTMIARGAALNMNVPNNVDRYLLGGRHLSNAGTVTWATAGISIGGGSLIDNEQNGVFDIQNDNSILYGGGGATFLNEGLFRKSAGTGTTQVNPGVSFNNTGTVELDTGTLLLADGASTGSFSVDPGATLNFATGAFDLNAGTTFSGAGLVQFGGATVSVNAPIGIGNAVLSLGTLTGNGTLTVDDQLTWTSGTMSGAGMTIIPSGMALFNINGSDNKYLTGREIVNQGTIMWNSATPLWLGSGAAILNEPGGLFDVQGDAPLLLNGGAASFQNDGMFQKSAGTGTTEINAGISFNSTGSIDIPSGALLFDGPITNSGSITVDANSTLTMNGLDTDTGTLTILAGGTLDLVGGATSSGTLDVEGTLLLAAGANLTASGSLTVNGSLAVPPAATLELAGTSTGGGAGSLSVDGTFLLDAGAMFSFAGTYSETGSLTVANNALLSLTGAFTNFDPSSGTLTGGTYTIAGTFQFTGANILTNAANLVLDGSGPGQIVDEHGNNGLANFATNASGSRFTVQNGENFATSGDFTNSGTLSIGATSTFAVSGNLTNFDPSSGTLSGGTYTVAGTFQFTGANILTNDAVLVLDGSGPGQIMDENGINALMGFALNDVNGMLVLQNGYNLVTGGSFTNLGYLLLDSTSRLTVSGDYTQGTAATLEIQLGGVGQSGQMSIGGNANLGGTLTLTPVNGYTPMTGDSFQIMTFVSRNGTDFANPPAGFGEAFDDTNGTLTVVAQ